EHVAKNALSGNRSHGRARHHPRPRRFNAGGWHRFSSRTNGPRECIPQRSHTWHVEGGNPAEIRRNCGVFRDREVHRNTRKALLSGMYLRLAFSVAAHLEPEVLFVDEVLAVGDARFYAKCINKMRSLHGS